MHRHRQITVVNSATNVLSGILVVPLYYVSGGVGVGPDGEGLRSASKPVVMKPFLFDSGEDLMTKQVPSKGVIVPPLAIYAGTSRMVYRWLLLKKGYSPLVIDQRGVWAGGPIIMTISALDQVSPCIETLLAAKPDQDAIKSMMEARSMTGTVSVLLDTNDRPLLQNYRSQP